MQPAGEPTYPGGELELFAQALGWKRYWISRLEPYLRGAILEVGAGIGSNTLLACRGTERRWVCLEPDPALAATLRNRVAYSAISHVCEVRCGTIQSLAPEESFDTVLYIDVLEHIEDDQGELRAAAEHLHQGGHLVVLSPAHAALYSPFDQAIGHYRRYTLSTLAELTPPKLRVKRSFYLDSAGLLASAANRLLLRQSMPEPRQLRFWDNCLIPCSRWLDWITGYRLGKSAVCVWERRPR